MVNKYLHSRVFYSTYRACSLAWWTVSLDGRVINLCKVIADKGLLLGIVHTQKQMRTEQELRKKGRKRKKITKHYRKPT